MPNSNFEKHLSDHLSKIKNYPYLFIGSGLSIRYFNLDNWNNLLKNICIELKLGDYSRYSSFSNQDATKVAEMMADDFKDIWWDKDDFSESRKLFSANALNSESPLKYEICNYIKKKAKLTLEKDYLEEIELLTKSKIDGVITTNWDNFLEENIFKDFNCFIGQDELLFSDSFDIGIIYKIHGGINDPNSLILTRSDYDKFENTYAYLAAKLLTVFVEHPVIFLGYSIQDKNIQNILTSIVKCLSNKNISKLQDRLIFCDFDSNITAPTFQDSNMIIGDTILPIKLIKANSFKSLFNVLSNLKRGLPIKILKNMKDMVHEFIKSSEPKSQVYVSDDLSKLENESNVEFVYGIGILQKLAKVGLKKLKIDELIKDYLFNENKLEALDVCLDWIPEQKGQIKYIPYFKYLKEANFMSSNNEIIESSNLSLDTIKVVKDININYFSPSGSILKRRDEINNRYNSLDDIFNDTSILESNKYIFSLLLDLDKINLEKFLDILRINYESAKKDKNNISNYRRLVCYYDYLKYIHFSKND